MELSPRLQSLCFPVEAAVCLLDRERDYRMKDDEAIAVFELLLDLYAFGDTKEALAERIRELGCGRVVEIVERELAGEPREDVARAIGTARFTACRRNDGRRAHMTVLQQCCGTLVRSDKDLGRLRDAFTSGAGGADGP